MRFCRHLLFLVAISVVTSGFAQQSTTVRIVTTVDSSPRPATYRCVIDSMICGETMYIKWISSGCYHHYADSILVTRNYSGFSVKHNGRYKMLSDKQADVIRDFEYEVSKFAKSVGLCTTSEYFIYKQRNKTYTAGRDGTCHYDLFTDLLTKLGI